MKVLEESSDAIDMYLHHLPDQLTYSVTYKIATPDDMELMMSSRLEMLKVVNDLNYTYEYSDEIVKGSREYFEKGDHTTVLAMDGKRVIGCYANFLSSHRKASAPHECIYDERMAETRCCKENGIDADRRSPEAGSY